jgi:hypothetical protein
MSAGTALVSFEQMERMAATVAKSGLFGMRTPEQALALMLLAQAEGIPAMIAVRDYHIMGGKPTMKADTMLARFQESGGSVEWHTYTDDKCEATFSHPKSPKPVRIDWTLDRAKRALLADKDVWKAYSRAMLRSRVISEGVKTCYPVCIAGKYTPEEIQSIDVEVAQVLPIEKAIESFDQPVIVATDVDTHMRNIATAPDLAALRDVFAVAYRLAKDANDEKRMESFKTAYEARKAELAEASAP